MTEPTPRPRRALPPSEPESASPDTPDAEPAGPLGTGPGARFAAGFASSADDSSPPSAGTPARGGRFARVAEDAVDDADRRTRFPGETGERPPTNPQPVPVPPSPAAQTAGHPSVDTPPRPRPRVSDRTPLGAAGGTGIAAGAPEDGLTEDTVPIDLRAAVAPQADISGGPGGPSAAAGPPWGDSSPGASGAVAAGSPPLAPPPASAAALPPPAPRPELGASLSAGAAPGTPPGGSSGDGTTSPPGSPGEADASDRPGKRFLGITWDRKAIGIAAGVFVILVALVLMLIFIPKPVPEASPTTEPSESAISQVDVLESSMITPGELSTLADTDWQIVTSETELTPESPRPQCLGSPTTSLTPIKLQQQVLKGSGDQDPVLLQLSQVFASGEEAEKAFAEISAALGVCDPGPAFLTTGLTVSDFADEVTGIVVDLGAADYRYHTLVAARTGATVNIWDAAGPTALVSAQPLVVSATAGLDRLCEAAGACPESPKAGQTVPPRADPAGWLQPADLPRIKNEGLWARTDDNVEDTAQYQSQCENMNFAQEPGPSERAVKSYIPQGDAAAPTTFGVDMFVFTFADNAAANSFASKLNTNIAQCGNRARGTATVARGAAVTGTGAGGTAVTGQSYLVTRSPSETEKVLYRVAVVTAGARVVYLSATPTAGYNFTDDQWKALIQRAGERSTQA